MRHSPGAGELAQDEVEGAIFVMSEAFMLLVLFRGVAVAVRARRMVRRMGSMVLVRGERERD